MTNFKYHIVPFGELAILMQFEDSVISEKLQVYIANCCEVLKTKSRQGIVSLIPAYNSITIFFHPKMTNREALIELVSDITTTGFTKKETSSVTHKIPVCYELGIDVKEVLDQKKISFNQLVEIHSQKSYLVHFLGFVPGFMYLGGLNPQLHIERKSNPRLKIPAGAVALGGEQTGVYPLETPGGWQIIGQTPIKMFSKEKGALVNMGDRVKFSAISKEEFKELKFSFCQ